MTTEYVSPWKVVTNVFGIRPLAKILEISPSAVHRWKDSNEGQIPTAWQRKILLLAKERGVRLTEKTLIWGK